MEKWGDYEINDDYSGEVYELTEDTDVLSFMVNDDRGRKVCGLEDDSCFIDDMAEHYGVNYLTENIVKNDNQEDVMENVMEMALPKKEITLDITPEELDKLSNEDKTAFILKMLANEKANGYLKLPNGEVLKDIFITLLNNGVNAKTADSIVVLMNEYLAKFAKSVSEKELKLQAEITELKRQIEEVKADSIVTKQVATAEIDKVKDSASKQVHEIKDNLQQIHDKNVEATKEKVAELKTGLETAVKETNDTVNQYYLLLEEKNQDILSLTSELEEIKLTQVSTSNELTAVMEQFDIVSNLTTNLLEEKKEVIVKLSESEIDSQKILNNVKRLEDGIIELKNYNEELLVERNFLLESQEKNEVFIEQLNVNVAKIEEEKDSNMKLVNELEKERLHFEQIVDENSEKVESLMESIKQLEDHTLDLETQSKIKDELIFNAKDLINKTNDNIDSLVEQNEVLLEEKGIAEAVIDENIQITEKLSIQVEENLKLAGVTEKLIEDNTSAKVKIAEVKSINSNLKIENSELEQELEQLRNRIELIKSKNSILEEQIKKSKKNLDEKNKKRNKKNNVNENSLSSKRKAMNQLLEGFDVSDEDLDFSFIEEKSKVVIPKSNHIVGKSNSKKNPMKGLGVIR